MREAFTGRSSTMRRRFSSAGTCTTSAAAGCASRPPKPRSRSAARDGGAHGRGGDLPSGRSGGANGQAGHAAADGAWQTGSLAAASVRARGRRPPRRPASSLRRGRAARRAA
ncbi:unnamed protein product, partial [Prorocentrum cordatum]